MKILGIIPSRYQSTRFPAKSLADIKGKSMVQRVYEQASKASMLSKVIVATDHEKIEKHVLDFGGEVAMTDPNHQSGTDRCNEVLTKLGCDQFDYVINIQGDEPFIDPKQIDTVAQLLVDGCEIATLIKSLESSEELLSPNTVKAVINQKGEALYFSRSPIPHLRGHNEEDWLSHHTFYKHIGIYAYRSDILQKISTYQISKLEKAESLEQLRWLEKGHKIMTAITEIDSLGIDTPEDLASALEQLKTQL